MGYWTEVWGTYGGISTLAEDPDAGLGCERLGGGDDALGAVDGASSAGELNEVRVRGRINGLRVERHFGVDGKVRSQTWGGLDSFWFEIGRML